MTERIKQMICNNVLFVVIFSSIAIGLAACADTSAVSEFHTENTMAAESAAPAAPADPSFPRAEQTDAPLAPAAPEQSTSPAPSAPATTALAWTHLSSANGDLPAPSNSTQQTAALVLDVDQDGLDDFVIGIRQGSGPSMVWYRRTTDGWTKYLIDDTVLDIEAGGAVYDLDGDGDRDIVMGGDYQSNQIWWWENPYPNYDPDTPWTRRLIKDSGSNMHHDQIFGDFDGDGRDEFVFWNQGASQLFLAEIPADPKTSGPWPFTSIYAGSGEGLAKADIDGDGKVDLLAGGRWFKHTGETTYTPITIDDSQRDSRIAVGDLKAGGLPEVVMVPGDGVGRLKWYECNGDPADAACWVGQDLLGFDVDHGHSLDIADLNDDDHLDIFVAEMRLDGGNADAKAWIFLGDGQGSFATTEVSTGFGNHESRIADLDGDGDLDILGKPYNWETPRVDVWLNNGSPGAGIQPLDRWERHVIDGEKPWRAIFITAADLDGDGLEDIVTGGWWYKNPGDSGADWTRQTIGAPLNNMAAVYDFDGDGHLDVLGTQGQGADTNAEFVWARNDGTGTFTIFDNIEAGDGDFLQGVAVERFQPGGPLEVALSWHAAGKGIQMLAVPDNPTGETWSRRQASPTSQDEALSVGDIDGDGQPDLLLGTRWLRNAGDTWQAYTLHDTGGDPDRNRLADINGDGRLDAVVGFEAISTPGKLAWYAQGSDPAALWTEHVIDTVIGPMSLDVADMDGDGDLDVVVGEHNTADPASAKLYVFENVDGTGTSWQKHLVYTGDEHHDGAQVVDIDGDGDLDIISIGWTHGRVLFYENTAGDGENNPPPTDQTHLPLVTNGPQALYTFEEGSGTLIRDVSGVGAPLDLTIGDEAAVRWGPGSLAVIAPTLIASAAAATKLNQAVLGSNEITIEAWITPASTTQDGPARIVTLSGDALNRNVMLGQGLWGDQPADLYDVRLRTTATDLNGTPSLSTAAGTLTTGLSHVVYTRTAAGVATIYVNGTEQASGTAGGDVSNWDAQYRLALANELSGDRPWLGEFHLVAIYNYALTPAAIDEHFDAGPNRYRG